MKERRRTMKARDTIKLVKHITTGGACYLTDNHQFSKATIVIRLDGGEAELVGLDKMYLSHQYTTTYSNK